MCLSTGGGLHPGGLFSIGGVCSPSQGVLHPGGSPSRGGSPSGGVLHRGGVFSIPGGSPSGGVLHPGGVLYSVNVRAVRILLECILVVWSFTCLWGFLTERSSAVEEPGFSDRGASLKGGGVSLLYWPFFPKNYMQLKKNCTKRRWRKSLARCIGTAIGSINPLVLRLL